MSDVALTPPATSRPVGAGGGGAVHDSFAADLPGAGGIPEQQANIAADNAAGEQRAVAQQTGDIAVAGAEAQQAGAEQAIPIANQYADAVKQAEAEFAPKLKKMGDEYDRAQHEASGRKYENHWQDVSTGKKVLLGISSFLGGLATGSPVSRAQEWIDRDYEHQKDEAARLMKVAEMKGADRNHLVELQDSILRNLNAGYLGKIEAVKRQVEAEAARQGTQQARVNAAKLIADLDTAAAVKKQEDAKALHVHAVAHTLKGLGLKGVQTTKLPNGQTLWKDPRTGLWEPFLSPAPTPAPAPGVSEQVLRNAPAPTQPPPQAAPPTGGP